MSTAHTEPLLRVTNVAKRFGGVHALQNVSMAVAPGVVHGLIGPNGAGKTTLFNAVTGLIPADAGQFEIQGRPYQPRQVHEVVQQGIARTFQNIRLFGGLSVLDNVLVGRTRHQRPAHRGLLGAVLQTASFRTAQAHHTEVALGLLDLVGLGEAAHQPAATLSYGAQRRLEIARALATEPTLLALDEPAAGMNSTEKAELATLLRALVDDRAGLTILLIEHDVRMVMSLCDRITVMHQGQVMTEGAPDAVRTDPAVIAAYLGAEVSA